jgi:hypothetical protein
MVLQEWHLETFMKSQTAKESLSRVAFPYARRTVPVDGDRAFEQFIAVRDSPELWHLKGLIVYYSEVEGEEDVSVDIWQCM